MVPVAERDRLLVRTIVWGDRSQARILIAANWDTRFRRWVVMQRGAEDAVCFVNPR